MQLQTLVFRSRPSVTCGQRVRALHQLYPQWLLHAPFWTQIWSGPLPGKSEWCVDPSENIRLAAALGVPIGTHWYGWNNELFVTHYPVYTPKVCFPAATKAMQSQRVHVVPYTNGRLFDPRDKKFTIDHAAKFACRRSVKGKPYTERYEHGRNWSFVTMDPGQQYWQKTVVEAVRDAQKAGNTSGVYIDQIASYYAEPCYGYNETGGGARWAKGNRATLSNAVKAIGPGRVIISESNAEAYLGSLHAYLAIYGFRQCNFVPAFQAVYGGGSVNVGSVDWPSSAAGIRILLAHQWTYGHVMGWTKPSVFLQNNLTLAYARLLAQLKVQHSQYLVFGRLMRPPLLSSPDGKPLNTTRWCQQPTQTCCQSDLVIAHVWMSQSGSLGLAITNPSRLTVNVVAKLRVDGYTHLQPEGRALVNGIATNVGRSFLEIKKIMPPLSAQVVNIDSVAP